MEILEEQQIGYFFSLRCGIDAGAHLMAALGTAIQRGGEHVVTCGAQAAGDMLPDPATLVGTMDKNESRHARFPRFCRRPVSDPSPPAALWTRGGARQCSVMRSG